MKNSRFQRFLNSLWGRLLISHLLIALIALSVAGVGVVSGIVPIYTALTYTRMEDNLVLAYSATQAAALSSQDLPHFLGRRDRNEMLGPGMFRSPAPEGDAAAPNPQQFLTQRFNVVFQRQLEGQNLRMLLVDLESRRITYDSAGSWEERTWAFLLPPEAALPPGTEPMTIRPARTDLVRSRARLDGRAWLYVAGNLGSTNADAPASALVLLTPSASLQDAGRYMRAVLPTPALLIVVAALAAIIWLLSAWFTRSLTRNLQPVITGTQEIAAGNLDYRVAESASSLFEIQGLGRSFNRMAAEVQAGRQAQRNLVVNVGHDLKTPLTSIQGFSQALVDGTAASSQAQARAAAIIYDEAQRLGKLVDELLDMARLDMDGLRLQRQPIPVRPFVDEVVQRYLPQFQAAGVRLIWEGAPDGLTILGDADRLQRVFANLLDNALAHTAPGGVVRLAGQAVAGQVEIQVVDDGAGIPQAELARIFERFYRVDKSRSGRRNAGLGLAIVRELVEAHGGSVGVESVEGQGSRFWVRLPLSG